MRLIIFFITISSLFLSSFKVKKQNESLIPVYRNGKYGYINYDGRIKIKAKFLSAYFFNEGLACARKEGLFGYINRRGEWAIQSRFDYGTEFIKGAALVWIDEVPALIDKKGSIVFKDSSITKANNLENGLFVFRTDSSISMINSKGRRLDFSNQVIQSCRKISDDRIVIYKREENSEKNCEHYYDCALINSNGELLVPFGRFTSIGKGLDGQILGRNYLNCDTEYTVFLDSKLSKIATINKGFFEGSGFSEGLLGFSYYYNDQSHGVYVDKNGDTVISNKAIEYTSPFSYGVSIISSHDSGYYMIDKKGMRISNSGYDYFVSKTGVNGKFLAKKNSRFFILDTLGREIVKLDYKYEVDYVIKGKYIVCSHRIKNDYRNKREEDYYSLLDFNGKVIVPFKRGLEFKGILNTGHIYGVKKNEHFIYKPNGKLIWSFNLNSNSVFNIDHKARSYYSVSSKLHQSDLGGFAKSDNSSIPIKGTKEEVNKKDDSLILEYKPSLNQILVINLTGQTQYFNGINSCLYLCLEAKNKHGEWKAVEIYPRSWCGNSYHTLQLESGNQWILKSRKYEGAFQTKLRYSLKVLTEEPSRNKKTPESYFVYSDEFEGSINPAQFWRVKPYYSSGLMDANY